MVTELDLLLLKVSLDHFLPIENFGYSYFIFQNFTKQKDTSIENDDMIAVVDYFYYFSRVVSPFWELNPNVKNTTWALDLSSKEVT